MADLEALKIKRDQLNARIQRAEALNRASETKADNRVKVLVGAAILEQCRGGQYDTAGLVAMMGQFLSRPAERLAVLGAEGTGSDSLLRLTGKSGG